MVDLKSGKLWGLDGFRSFSGSCQVSKIWCPKSTTNFLLLFRGNQSGILFFCHCCGGRCSIDSGPAVHEVVSLAISPPDEHGAGSMIVICVIIGF